VTITTRSPLSIAAGALAALLSLAPPGAARAAPPDAGRAELAHELARLMIDDTVRRDMDEQIGTGMVRVIQATLQQRLNRPLQESEGRVVVEIVRRFIAETPPSAGAEAVAARAYASHFDDAELRDLLAFQRSEVGRKAWRLAPVIATETSQALNAEVLESPAMPRLLAELQGAFPVLRSPESP